LILQLTLRKRRNVPVRYDRELVKTTIQAMKRVGEIKARRERAFFKNRMAISRDKKLSHRKKDFRGLKSVGQITSTNLNRRKAIQNARENQGSRQSEECSDTRRRAIHGYGYRLKISHDLPTALSY